MLISALLSELIFPNFLYSSQRIVMSELDSQASKSDVLTPNVSTLPFLQRESCSDQIFFCGHSKSGDTNLIGLIFEIQQLNGNEQTSRFQLLCILRNICLFGMSVRDERFKYKFLDAQYTSNPLFVILDNLFILLPSLELSQILGTITKNISIFETICSLCNLQKE